MDEMFEKFLEDTGTVIVNGTKQETLFCVIYPRYIRWLVDKRLSDSQKDLSKKTQRCTQTIDMEDILNER